MNLLTQFFESLQSNPWVQNVGWTLLHSLWQVTLIAILYAVASCAMRSRSASLRYVMGCIAMATMLLMPLATFYVLSPVPEQVATKIIEPPTTEVSGTLPDQQMASTPPVFSQVPQADPVSSPDSEITPDKAVQIADAPTLLERASGLVRPWLPVLTVCWLVGVMLLSLRPVAGCLRVRTLRRTGLTALCEPHAALTKQLMNRLGIRQAVQFAQSALVEVPTVIGYLRPMVLLPASAVTGLTTAELELILAHELAHIRRHDYAVNLIQTIIEALLFYHPAMWWLSKDVRRERENCCDDVAVSISGDRTTYIRALAQLEEHRVAPPALAATGGSLLGRVRRLVDKPEAEFGYRKSSLWLTASVVVGITLAGFSLAGTASEQDSASDKGLAALTTEQMETIAKRVQDVVDNVSSLEELVNELKTMGPKSVQGLVPLMQRGSIDQVAMDAFEPFLDQPQVREYLEEVLLDLRADPNKPANQSHCCLFLLAKCPPHSHPASSEVNHVNLCAKFLKVNPIVSLGFLGSIKGNHAREQLIAAFDQLATEHWWQIAKALERTGDAAAVPELKRRLREVELPPNDRFPNITVSAFTDAIYNLSGGEHANTSFNVGGRCIYPFDGPGTPSSFTATPLKNHYIDLPKVDSSTDGGRTQIWQAIRDQTPGPGVIIDRDQMVLLNGLKAIPLDLGKTAKLVDFDKYLCEKTTEEFKTLFQEKDSSGRVTIPNGDWILAMDPANTLHLLRLRKTTDDSAYNVYFSRRLPLVQTNAMMVADADSLDGEENLLNFDKLVGKKVARLVRDVNLPFVDEQRLQDIEKDFTNFISSSIPGTYAVGASIPEGQRKEILRAIEKHGAQHLGLDRFRQTELRSINSAYLKLPDRLMTLKWKLYRAIVNARKLDQEKQAKLGAQRSWMRKHVQSLPPNRFYTHEQVLSALEERLADPLACTLAYPMTDEQFDLFRQGLKKYAPQGELNHVVPHIVQQSLNAQYRDFTDFETPFKDRVVSYGWGRVVKLGFEQNRPFESSLLSISDIEESNTVINAVTGSLVTVPDDSRRDRSVEHWLNEEGRGDFGFDDARGGGLFAVRGAKLVKLDVKTWHEADAISNKELRALLNGPSAGRTVSLGKHYQDHQHDNGAPYCYAGVLTKEGQLAVAAVEGFSGRSSIDVRTRVRSALSEMKTAKLSDEEVNSDRTIKAPKDVTDVQSYKDGGTTSFILHRPGQQPIRVCFDYRDQPPVEESSWKTAGNLTLGRMFTGADYPEKPNAKLVKLGSEEEKRLLNDLNAWLDQQLSKELQSRMLSEVRSAESLRRLAATMGKSVDDLRELSSLLRKTRQYELVFVQSNGVYVTLERQAEPQANPSRIPPLLISVVNRGDIEKLTFGQTDQAFELEVDGNWYRQGRREYKSSPLPPGRIYDPFPLTLDQRWQHESAPLKLSPGQHTIRVRCSVAPLSSNRDASLATSQPMTVTVGPQRAEKESATDPEQTSQAQPDHKQLPLDIQNACRDHLRTMPPTKKLSARARSIDHARLQVIAHHIAKEKAIGLLQVGGPEQVDPGSNRDNNETFWCCQLNRKDKAPANGGWKVTDTQVVSSVIKYRALEIAFAQENRSPYPPGSTKSRRANVNGPDGAGLADVLVKAFVFGEFEPVLVAKTDREGHFLLPNSPPGVEPTNDQGAISRGYRLEFSKPGCLPWKKNVFVNLDADGNYDRSAFLMRKSTVVSGKLLGVDGKPLAGKKVRLRSIILYPDTRFEDAYDWTETKPDGSFRYENVWPGRHLVQSWQANDQEKNDPAKGRTAAVIVETSDFENGKLTVDDVVLDLSKSFSTLAVTVLDQDGQPVPKAEIDIIWRPLIGQWGGGSLSCSLLNEHYPKVKTNDAGKATLTGLPPGVWEIRAGRLASDPWKFASERLTFKEGDKLEATLQFSKPIDPNDFDLNSIHIR